MPILSKSLSGAMVVIIPSVCAFTCTSLSVFFQNPLIEAFQENENVIIWLYFDNISYFIT